ncbi:thioredoxin [Anaplasma marginale str. Dawn]|uniref:Thioredoxin n=2 Tax=Anaplasma marginale TaxID=770 RepID=B9KHJ8_ANAMF|nr:thioredoxin (trxA) [Anaplasma marginale str. Florida]AGZ78543.1 thioredoxin [Anaplasma marginale str. Gypsy Plains]AGZ79393.1 thioredoxin [Anaplasma marginale str. Dawn]
MEGVMSNIAEVGDSDFPEKVCVGSGLVLVDFWAPWCGPCVALSPQLEKLAQKYEGKLKIYKLNIQNNQDTPVSYGVSAVPTLVIFSDGKELSRVVGANLQQIIGAIDSAVGGTTQ